MRRLLALVVVALVVFVSASASAAVRRYALVVGNDHGDEDDVVLRYAGADAQRIYDTLKDLGGFEPADMVLLRDEQAPRMQTTLIALNDRIRATIAEGSQAVLFVYYSGHGGADALHLSGTRLDVALLEQLVRGSAATFRVLLLDACRSGVLTRVKGRAEDRVKGGRAAPPFALTVDEHLAEEGLVFFTSSAANEDAQESDELRGSFFTHYFVSALLGPGDEDHDGKVTLEEAYRYAYEGTLRSSSATWAGLQHPTFRYELQGAGKLALTEPRVAGRGRATLAFPDGRAYLVMDGDEHGPVEGEVTSSASARTLSVRPGRYFVRGRAPDALLEGSVDVQPGSALAVTDDRLRRIQYARLVRKGRGERRAAVGPEGGYLFHTALGNASGLCQGGFAGYLVQRETVSFGARLSACHEGFTTETIHASAIEAGGELRVVHTWDLPLVGVDLGLAAGGWLLAQTFTARGTAPARYTPAASLAPALGLHVDLGAGVSLLEESALATYIYSQQISPTVTSFAPYVAFRQIVGVAKAW